MTNQQLIEKIKETAQNHNLSNYFAYISRDNNLVVARFNPKDPISYPWIALISCDASDMTEELDLRPLMRKFQVTDLKTQEVTYHFALTEHILKTLGYRCRYQEVEIK